jgi:hypothetical protein
MRTLVSIKHSAHLRACNSCDIYRHIITVFDECPWSPSQFPVLWAEREPIDLSVDLVPAHLVQEVDLPLLSAVAASRRLLTMMQRMMVVMVHRTLTLALLGARWEMRLGVHLREIRMAVTSIRDGRRFDGAGSVSRSTSYHYHSPSILTAPVSMIPYPHTNCLLKK